MTDEKEKKVQTTVRLKASVEQRLKRHVYRLKMERGPGEELPTREAEIEAAINEYLDRFEAQSQTKPADTEHAAAHPAEIHAAKKKILRRAKGA